MAIEEGTMLPCGVMESMRGIVGDGVTLADGTMGVVVACDTGGAMLLGGAMGWHGSMAIVESAEMGGMAIDKAMEWEAWLWTKPRDWMAWPSMKPPRD